jgi:hypothetical protein
MSHLSVQAWAGEGWAGSEALMSLVDLLRVQKESASLDSRCDAETTTLKRVMLLPTYPPI